MEFLNETNKINYSILIITFISNKKLNLNISENINTFFSKYDEESHTYIYYRFVVIFFKLFNSIFLN